MKKNILISVLILSFSSPIFAQVWRPIKKTCDDYNRSIAEDFLKRSVVELEAMPDVESLAHIRLSINGGPAEETLYYSFIFFMAPSLSIAEKVVRANFLTILEEKCKIISIDTSLTNLLKEMKSCGEKIIRTETIPETKRDILLDPMSKKNQEVLLKLQEWLQKNVKLPIENNFNKLGGIMQALAPRINVAVSHEIIKLDLDPELRVLSEKVFYFFIDRMLKAQELNTVGDSDIFSDLTNFFIGQGYSEERSRSLSFYYIGLFATRGASIYSHFADRLAPSSWLSLHALSMAISYLDKMAQQEGKSYIFPKRIIGECHLGKPYHFWLAAFQTYYLKQQGISATEAYLMPIIGGISYDFTMTANGRDIEKLFKIKTPYDEYANGTRLDNWARALGAHFGRHGGRILPISRDKILEKNFSLGRMPSQIPKTDQEKIKEYFRIVNPIPMFLRLSL